MAIFNKDQAGIVKNLNLIKNQTMSVLRVFLKISD